MTTIMNEIDILKDNVHELQKSLQEAYKHIAELKEENDNLKKQLFGEPTDGC